MQSTKSKPTNMRGHIVRLSDGAWGNLQVVALANYFKSRTQLLNSLNDTNFRFLDNRPNDMIVMSEYTYKTVWTFPSFRYPHFLALTPNAHAFLLDLTARHDITNAYRITGGSNLGAIIEALGNEHLFIRLLRLGADQTNFQDSPTEEEKSVDFDSALW